jgi:hypothetical protein
MVQFPAALGRAIRLISTLSTKLADIAPAFSVMAAIHAI